MNKSDYNKLLKMENFVREYSNYAKLEVDMEGNGLKEDLTNPLAELNMR